jgi:hypothetical protein
VRIGGRHVNRFHDPRVYALKLVVRMS